MKKENATHAKSSAQSKPETTVRIDKWLWAARFYRTRTTAKDAIDGGKVHFQGERVKVSKDVRIGMEFTIRQGFEEKTVVVTALSVIRGNATAAHLLYEETPASIAKRELFQAARKLSNLARPDHRPNKHERQQLQRFKNTHSPNRDEIIDDF